MGTFNLSLHCFQFMIEEHEAYRKEKLQQEYNDAYWEQHYTVCRDRIPVFLETVADKILRTGKYLNVIRECGRDPKCPHAEEILYTLKERQYVDHIDHAYQYASKVLLYHIMEDRELMPRLRYANISLIASTVWFCFFLFFLRYLFVLSPRL